MSSAPTPDGDWPGEIVYRQGDLNDMQLWELQAFGPKIVWTAVVVAPSATKKTAPLKSLGALDQLYDLKPQAVGSGQRSGGEPT